MQSQLAPQSAVVRGPQSSARRSGDVHVAGAGGVRCHVSRSRSRLEHEHRVVESVEGSHVRVVALHSGQRAAGSRQQAAGSRQQDVKQAQAQHIKPARSEREAAAGRGMGRGGQRAGCSVRVRARDPRQPETRGNWLEHRAQANALASACSLAAPRSDSARSALLRLAPPRPALRCLCCLCSALLCALACCVY